MRRIDLALSALGITTVADYRWRGYDDPQYRFRDYPLKDKGKPRTNKNRNYRKARKNGTLKKHLARRPARTTEVA